MAKCIASYNGSENKGAEKVTIINFLIGKGFTPNQVAGIMGNLEQENGFNSTTESKDTNGKTSSGIVQWNGGRSDRLKEFAKQNNKEWTDLGLQLDYMWSELNGSYKKDVLDWFQSNPNATVKEAEARWEKYYEACGICEREKRVKYAEEALEFYNKYANTECSDVTTPSATGSGNAGGVDQAILTDATVPTTTCGVRVNSVINNTDNTGGTSDNTNNPATADVTTGANTTDYKGKTLTLRLEREEFSCDRTFGSLYDTTDGKKQLICYTVEDRVRYKGNKCSKVAEQTAIPYGTYSFSLASAGAAKKCGGSVTRDCRYYYAADYKKYPKYNGKMALLSGVNNDGCSFTQILIHASTNNNRADESNSAGCIIVGTTKNGTYLSGAQDAYYKLYEEYIFPAAEAGSSMKIEIPRLYQDKDQNC